MRHNFVAFILTHGRPDSVFTYKLLRGCGYTGRIVLIVDDEDKSLEEYWKLFGKDSVYVFNKKSLADSIDEGNNFDERRTITHARNACFDAAKEIGATWFIELDDDYYYFGYRDLSGAKKIKNIDLVFDSMIDFLIQSKAETIAFSQGGDHIGGYSGQKLKRKAMNSFIFNANSRVRFVGGMNEDVNTYVTLGARGLLFFTFTGVQLDQKDTQSQAAGITDMYNKYGTYCKSFTTTMMAPSCVKVSMMSSKHKRIHHKISWGNAVPCIISERYKQ
jgi:hypothetical protein